MVYVCCVRLSEALTEPVIKHNFTKIPLPSKSFVFSQKLAQFYEVVLVYLNRTARWRKLRHSHSLTVLLREQTTLVCFADVVTPSWSEANGSLDLTLLTNFLWVILKRGWLSYLRARASVIACRGITLSYKVRLKSYLSLPLSFLWQLARSLAEHVLYQALFSSHHSCQSFSTSLAGFRNLKRASKQPSVAPESKRYDLEVCTVNDNSTVYIHKLLFEEATSLNSGITIYCIRVVTV